MVRFRLSYSEDIDKALTSLLDTYCDDEIDLSKNIKYLIRKEGEFYHKDKAYQFSFDKFCEWQKYLFDIRNRKINTIQLLVKDVELTEYYKKNFPDLYKGKLTANRVAKLPNQNINLGIRQTDIDENKAKSLFLSDMVVTYFPIKVEKERLYLSKDVVPISFRKSDILADLTLWYYNMIEIQFFESFNEELAFIFVNIISYNLFGKYIVINK